MLRAFCDAVERRDGKAFAALFTEDGVYHDVFYGTFSGRAKIAAMIGDWFYWTATDFRWDLHEPVSDGETLYRTWRAVLRPRRVAVRVGVKRARSVPSLRRRLLLDVLLEDR